MLLVKPKPPPKATLFPYTTLFRSIASGPNQNEVVLYVYTKVDTITTDSEMVTVPVCKTITRPLLGGLSDTTKYPSIAANKLFLFFGTRQNPVAVEINKRTFSVTQL